MSEVTVSLPEPLSDWIEKRVREGGYASAGDYLRDLVKRDHSETVPELSLEDLRTMISESRASGRSAASFEALVAGGDRLARSRGLTRG